MKFSNYSFNAQQLKLAKISLTLFFFACLKLGAQPTLDIVLPKPIFHNKVGWKINDSQVILEESNLKKGEPSKITYFNDFFPNTPQDSSLIGSVNINYQGQSQTWNLNLILDSLGRRYREIASLESAGSEFLYFQRTYSDNIYNYSFIDNWYNPDGTIKHRIFYELLNNKTIRRAILGSDVKNAPNNRKQAFVIESFNFDSIKTNCDNPVCQTLNPDYPDLFDYEAYDLFISSPIYRSTVDIKMVTNQGIPLPDLPLPQFNDGSSNQYGWDVFYKYKNAHCSEKIFRYKEKTQLLKLADDLDLFNRRFTKYTSTADSQSTFINATFPGGRELLKRKLFNRISSTCMIHGENIDVLVRFNVDVAGKISDIEALHEPNNLVCAECTGQFNKLLRDNTRWIPAQLNGRYIESSNCFRIRLHDLILSLDSLDNQQVGSALKSDEVNPNSEEPIVFNNLIIDQENYGDIYYVNAKYNNNHQLSEVIHFKEEYDKESRLFTLFMVRKYVFQYERDFCKKRTCYEMNFKMTSSHDRIKLDSLSSMFANQFGEPNLVEIITAEYSNTSNDIVIQTNYKSNNNSTKGLQTGYKILLQLEQKKFKGAWFDVKYPANFRVHESMKSITFSENCESAFFLSPDSLVEFYVFSPQWRGDASDIKIKPSEILVNDQKRTLGNTIVREWKISSLDKSYVRQYTEKIDKLSNSNLIFGIKYKNEEALLKYKDHFSRFQNSINQYAD